MKQLIMRVILLCLLLAGSELVYENAAYAQDDTLRPVNLTVQPPEGELMAGQKVVVMTELLNDEGRPIPNAPLTLFLDGEQFRRKRTDENGQAPFSIRKNTLTTGTYTVNIVYGGSKIYQPVEQTISLDIKQALLQIEVVPAIEGVTFSLKKLPEPEKDSSSNKNSQEAEADADADAEVDAEANANADAEADADADAEVEAPDPDQAATENKTARDDAEQFTPEEIAALETAPEWQATSDANGLLRFEVDQGGNYYLAVIGEQTPEDMRIQFERWSDKGFDPQRKITLPRVDLLQVGFETSHIVSQSFFDPDGQPVSLDRIESFTLKSSHGSLHEYKTNEPDWVQTGRVVKRRTGLEETKIFYSADSVIIDGSSVVNKGKQCFFVSKTNDPEEDGSLAAVPKRCQNAREWPIDLLLYSVSFSAIDGVFQFSIGSGIFLHYPDERIEEVEFGEDGSVQLHNLARGIYKAQVMDVKGMAPLTPVAVSRNQEVPLKVLTALDMGVAVTLALILAIGLLYFGRPQWFNWFLPARFHRQPRPFPFTGAFRFTGAMRAVGETDNEKLKNPTIGQRLSAAIRHSTAHFTAAIGLTTPTRFIIKMMEQKQDQKPDTHHLSSRDEKK